MTSLGKRLGRSGLAFIPAGLALVASSAWAGPAELQFLVQARDEEPVKIAGAALADFDRRLIADLALFKWDATLGAFAPIPFQIDERIDKAFNPGTPAEFHEIMFDVFNEDDGRLDALDELVFLFGDAGADEAPPDALWPPSAEARRYVIEVTDPREGAPVPERHVYLFAGPSLPRSPLYYIQWDGMRTSGIQSSTWMIGYTDRWILDRYMVLPPCGTGADLIDRFKGRAGRNLEMESEQDWNASSTYLGGIAGPVRAARYVRGAASGINTIHYDVIYRGFWERGIHLRVHPIGSVAFYIDLRPGPDITLFTDRVAAGVPVDGIVDFGMGFTLIDWSVVRSPNGGLALLFDVPPSPYVGSRRLYYRDDVDYNDATAPYYDDEDHSSFGAHGVELRDLAGSETTNIPGYFRIYPLCSNVGDAELGAGLQEQKDNPFQVGVVPETRHAGPVRTLLATRVMANVSLSWNPIPGADEYHVYVAEAPWVPRESWTLLGETPSATFIDVLGVISEQPRYYSILGVAGGEEGDW